MIDALRVLQPHTANNTRLCAAISYTSDYPWIMIPCNTSMETTLQICETSISDTPHLEPIENEYLHYLEWNNPYAESGRFAKLNVFTIRLYAHFAQVIRNSFYGIYFDLSQLQYLTYCRPGWIMAKGLCFLLINRKGSIRDCFTDDSIVKINLSHIIDSSVLDYLTIWSVPESHYIYLLDEVNEVINSYTCRRFTIMSAHDDYYTLSEQLLSVSIVHNVSCGPDDIEYLLCFQEPIIANDSCPGRMFQCRDQSCISDFHRCDSQDDCPSGEDEYDCNTACSLDDAAHCTSHTSTLKDTCGDLYFHCGVGDCIHIAFVSWISIISYEYITNAFCFVRNVHCLQQITI